MYDDKRYKPLSAWGYFGYELLFNIPLAGLILLIVFSFSNKNINRRNFARAHFCALAVIIVVVAAAAVLSLIFGFSASIISCFGQLIKKL